MYGPGRLTRVAAWVVILDFVWISEWWVRGTEPECYDKMMPLKPDDMVCYCFHVPLRKIESFCRIEKPRYPSQISECLSAGTGCGWCVPLLKKIHQELCPSEQPWWRREADVPAKPTALDSANVDDAQSYAAARQQYIARKKELPAGEEF